jgi:hypothetical protein
MVLGKVPIVFKGCDAINESFCGTEVAGKSSPLPSPTAEL